MTVRKTSTDDLKIGMYVTELDRPWTDTPFMFQGFQLGGEEDIHQLKQLCKHVYIVVPDEEIELESPRKPAKESPPVSPFDGAGVKPRRYAVERPFEEELPHAKESYRNFSNVVVEMTKDIRRGDVVDPLALSKSVKTMTASVIRNPDPFLWLIRVKEYDSYTYRHMINVSVWAASLGRQLELPQSEIDNIALGGMCLDIGILKLPRELLLKKGPLSPAEKNLFKTHVDQGIKTLSDIPGIHENVITMVRSHHERFNGSGYPRGFNGENIPLLGRIAGIVDDYVSMTSPRAERPLSSLETLDLLFRTRDQLFDTELVYALVQLVGLYPTGSIVKLSTGETAIVMSQSSTLRLRPTVVVILDSDNNPNRSHPIIDLMTHTHDKNGQPLSITKGLADGDYGFNYSSITM